MRTDATTFLTVGEVAATLRVSRASVYRAVRNGQLRGVRLTGAAGAIRIPSRELEQLVVSRQGPK